MLWARQRFILYHQDLSVTSFSSGRSHWYLLFLSSTQWKNLNLHFLCIFRRIPSLFPVKVSVASRWPKGPNVIYDSWPRRVSSSPYFRLQNGWNFFPFPSKPDSPEHCDTSTQFAFVSFIKRPAQCPPPQSFIFIHLLNRSMLIDATLAFSPGVPKSSDRICNCPRKCWVDAFFSRTERKHID